MPPRPWIVGALARARRPIGPRLVLGLVFAGLAGSATAQVASPGRSDPRQVMSITVGNDLVPYIFRIEPIQASSGVPRHDVVCAPRQGTQQRPGIVCDIRFDQPTKLAGYTVGESADPGTCLRPGDCWTSSLAPIAASGGEIADDSAFLFMIDNGGRDAGTVKREGRDVAAILANAGPRQQIAVATFSRSLKVISDFGADRSIMKDEAAIRPDGGRTELYKSAIDGIRLLDARHARRKFLVILSDGSANDTAYDGTALVKAAAEANVKVIAVGYAPDPHDTTKLQGLGRIADDTGGAYLQVLGAGQLPAQAQKGILTASSSGYLLTADAPTNALPAKIDVLLRFDQNRTSLIPVDTATTPSLNGPPPSGGTAAAAAATAAAPTLLDRLKDNWILVAGAAAALVALVAAAVLVADSRRARARRAAPPPPAPVFPEHRPDMPYAPPTRHAFEEPPPRHGFEDPSPRHGFDGPHRDDVPIEADREAGREADRAKTMPQSPDDGLARTVVAAPAGGEGPPQPITFIEIEEQGRSRRVPISKNLASVGRNPENDIVLPADNVSREHAQIISDEHGGWEIRNLTWRRPAAEGGVNPIAVNGHQIDAETHPLRNGDVIRFGNIGKTNLTFRHSAQRFR